MAACCGVSPHVGYYSVLWHGPCFAGVSGVVVLGGGMGAGLPMCEV